MDTSNITKVYSTRGTQQKLLNDAMAASKSKTTTTRKLRSTSVIEEEDIPNDKSVDVFEGDSDSTTKLDEDLVSLKQHTEETKGSRKPTKGSKEKRPRRKEERKSKRGEFASTIGPGSHIKRAKIDKILRKEERIQILEK